MSNRRTNSSAHNPVGGIPPGFGGPGAGGGGAGGPFAFDHARTMMGGGGPGGGGPGSAGHHHHLPFGHPGDPSAGAAAAAALSMLDTTGRAFTANFNASLSQYLQQQQQQAHQQSMVHHQPSSMQTNHYHNQQQQLSNMFQQHSRSRVAATAAAAYNQLLRQTSTNVSSLAAAAAGQPWTQDLRSHVAAQSQQSSSSSAGQMFPDHHRGHPPSVQQHPSQRNMLSGRGGGSNIKQSASSFMDEFYAESNAAAAMQALSNFIDPMALAAQAARNQSTNNIASSYNNSNYNASGNGNNDIGSAPGSVVSNHYASSSASSPYAQQPNSNLSSLNSPATSMTPPASVKSVIGGGGGNSGGGGSSRHHTPTNQSLSQSYNSNNPQQSQKQSTLPDLSQMSPDVLSPLSHHQSTTNQNLPSRNCPSANNNNSSSLIDHSRAMTPQSQPYGGPGSNNSTRSTPLGSMQQQDSPYGYGSMQGAGSGGSGNDQQQFNMRRGAPVATNKNLSNSHLSSKRSTQSPTVRPPSLAANQRTGPMPASPAPSASMLNNQSTGNRPNNRNHQQPQPSQHPAFPSFLPPQSQQQSLFNAQLSNFLDDEEEENDFDDSLDDDSLAFYDEMGGDGGELDMETSRFMRQTFAASIQNDPSLNALKAQFLKQQQNSLNNSNISSQSNPNAMFNHSSSNQQSQRRSELSSSRQFQSQSSTNAAPSMPSNHSNPHNHRSNNNSNNQLPNSSLTTQQHGSSGASSMLDSLFKQQHLSQFISSQIAAGSQSSNDAPSGHGAADSVFDFDEFISSAGMGKAPKSSEHSSKLSVSTSKMNSSSSSLDNILFDPKTGALKVPKKRGRPKKGGLAFGEATSLLSRKNSFSSQSPGQSSPSVSMSKFPFVQSTSDLLDTFDNKAQGKSSLWLEFELY